jgi:hypothetical protein
VLGDGLLLVPDVVLERSWCVYPLVHVRIISSHNPSAIPSPPLARVVEMQELTAWLWIRQPSALLPGALLNI